MDQPNVFVARVAELVHAGKDPAEAYSIADLETRILRWPAAWGDHLEVLIHGDFELPSAPLNFPELGIIVHPEPVTGSVIRARSVVRAEVAVSEKTVAGLEDAARRVNRLLGVIQFANLGNGVFRWWSFLTHDVPGGVGHTLEHETTHDQLERLSKLPSETQRWLDLAGTSIRGARVSALEIGHEAPTIQFFNGWWDAFECLVNAWLSTVPFPQPNEEEQQIMIDQALAAGGGKLSVAQFRGLTSKLNPPFPPRAKWALTACFGELAPHYIEQCFGISPREERLAAIRGRIKHGSAEISDRSKLRMIQVRSRKLWFMTMGMWCRILGYSGPTDPTAQ